ncbi:uncharacterized protein LOC135155179 [Lytechinus pictus]|uniref:uncharacterized protein LOC135155179 n=1 Tax=Lytechinus pictus TaxID=7653 RepID=UPI0030BA12EC
MADRQQVKVALWCIPRSRSTVLTKCLSAIEDIDIYFELYSVAALVGGCFETATGRKLPLKLDGNETAYEEAKDVWFKTTNMKIYPRRVSCHDIQEEVETTKSRFVLMKEMCQYKDYAQDYLPRDFRYVFVTREPTRAYASFRKVLLTTGLFVPADKKLDIIRDDPSNTRPMSWYESQHQLWRYVKDNLDPNPIIIDAYDLASNPQKILKGLCEAIGFPYNDSLLQWASSIDDFPQNFNTAGPNLFEGVGSGFFERAFKCTQFEAPTELVPIPRDQLDDDVIRCVDYSMPFYRELYANRLQ